MHRQCPDLTRLDGKWAKSMVVRSRCTNSTVHRALNFSAAESPQDHAGDPLRGPRYRLKDRCDTLLAMRSASIRGVLQGCNAMFILTKQLRTSCDDPMLRSRSHTLGCGIQRLYVKHVANAESSRVWPRIPRLELDVYTPRIAAKKKRCGRVS